MRERHREGGRLSREFVAALASLTELLPTSRANRMCAWCQR